MLPPGADAVAFEAGLEQIRSATREDLKKEQQHCCEQEQYWRGVARNLLKLLPGEPTAAVVARILDQAEGFKQRAEFLARYEPRWVSWRHIELCALAERFGIDLGYTLPRKGREPDYTESGKDRKRRPHGPGIRYLMAASKAIGQPIREHSARDRLVHFWHMKSGRAAFAGKGGLVASAGAIRPLANNAGVVILDD